MDRRVVAAKSLIEENPWLKVNILAKEVNLSASRLQHLFARHTGSSIRAYAQEARLMKAAVMLATTFLSIKEVRVKVGYRDTAVFSRAFKRQFGRSPTVYRSNSSQGSSPTLGAAKTGS